MDRRIHRWGRSAEERPTTPFHGRTRHSVPARTRARRGGPFCATKITDSTSHSHESSAPRRRRQACPGVTRSRPPSAAMPVPSSPLERARARDIVALVAPDRRACRARASPRSRPTTRSWARATTTVVVLEAERRRASGDRSTDASSVDAEAVATRPRCIAIEHVRTTRGGVVVGRVAIAIRGETHQRSRGGVRSHAHPTGTVDGVCRDRSGASLAARSTTAWCWACSSSVLSGPGA